MKLTSACVVCVPLPSSTSGTTMPRSFGENTCEAELVHHAHMHMRMHTHTQNTQTQCTHTLRTRTRTRTRIRTHTQHAMLSHLNVVGLQKDGDFLQLSRICGTEEHLMIVSACELRCNAGCTLLKRLLFEVVVTEAMSWECMCGNVSVGVVELVQEKIRRDFWYKNLDTFVWRTKTFHSFKRSYSMAWEMNDRAETLVSRAYSKVAR